MCKPYKWSSSRYCNYVEYTKNTIDKSRTNISVLEFGYFYFKNKVIK